MRQIVSLIKDNQAHFALVDEDDGSLIPFADLLIPDPDHFGLQESALLGTNLISALGLNGTKRPKIKIPRVGDLPAAAADHADDEQLALIAPPRETERERRNRIARERYAASKRGSTGPGRGNPGQAHGKGGATRYITVDEMVAIINQYPEGITTAQIAERIWRNEPGGGDGPVPKWLSQSLNNRQIAAENSAKTNGTQQPYRVEYRDQINADGRVSTKKTKYLLPLQYAVASPGAITPEGTSSFG